MADMINFIFESLNCARKGKVAVAYSMLRRPFTDELLLLEQLLANRSEFIRVFFYDGNPEKYDPASRSIRQNRTERTIIEGAMRKMCMPSILSAETIYRIRYDISHSNSIYGISNQALHIVTTRYENYKTRQQNLNFIFNAGPADYEQHCEHYYQYVPILLLHTAAICDELLFPFLPLEKYRLVRLVRAFKRLIAFGFLDQEDPNDFLSAVGEAIEFNCEKCRHNSQLNIEDFKLFLQQDLLKCSKCQHPHTFDESAIEMLEALVRFQS